MQHQMLRFFSFAFFVTARSEGELIHKNCAIGRRSLIVKVFEMKTE